MPHANAFGADSFQYEANDCTGDIFRVSAPGTVSIDIDAVNDVPTLAVHTFGATTNADEAIDFGIAVADVETDASELLIDITSLPTGTESQFYDGATPVLPSALPHRLTNAAKVLGFRFDSLAGLETSELIDGELLRTTAATNVSFTATDPDGGVLAAAVRLRLYSASFSCVAEDHAVVFEGEEAVCAACRPGVAASPGAPTCDICAEGFFRLSADDDAGSSCVACPETAVRCPRDATLETMELSAGWWRASNRSAEWHWCGETPGYVRFLLLPWLEGNSPSPGNRTGVQAQAMCLGGADGGETSCAANHLGPLCRSCNSSYFFDEVDLECKVCPDGGSVMGAIALVVVFCAVAVGLFRLLQGYFTRMEPRAGASMLLKRVDGCLRFLSKQLHNINAIRSNHIFTPSLKLIIAYCQVVYAVPTVYDVTMPDSYYRALGWLEFFTFEWLFELGIEAECLGGGGLATQLAVFGLVPFGVMLALPFVAICVEKLVEAFTAERFAPVVVMARRFSSSMRETSSKPRETSSKPIAGLPPGGVACQASSGKRVAAQKKRANQWNSRVGLSFLRTLPLSLFIAFVAVISVSHRVFSAFDCLELETDSLADPKASLQYVTSDMTLRCDASVPAYKEATDLAYTLIALWPVAMPLAFALTLLCVSDKLLKRRGTQLTRATSFLHKEYEAPYFWWEPLVLVQVVMPLPSAAPAMHRPTRLCTPRPTDPPVSSLLPSHTPPSHPTSPFARVQRLALTGWIQLVPGHMALLRIILGIFVSFTYTLLLMICKPYVSIEVDILAIISQASLVLLFVCAMLLKTFDLTEPAGIAYDVTGFSSKEQMASFVVIMTFAILLCFTTAALLEVRKQSQIKVLRTVQDHQVPRVDLGFEMSYHLFLSHAWSSAQDTAAIIKRMLTLLLPCVKVFLDVDDLEEIGRLETYVEESQCMLIMLTRGYFTSKVTVPRLSSPLSSSLLLSCILSPLLSSLLPPLLSSLLKELPARDRPLVCVREADGPRPRGGPQQGRRAARRAAARVREARAAEARLRRRREVHSREARRVRSAVARRGYGRRRDGV